MVFTTSEQTLPNEVTMNNQCNCEEGKVCLCNATNLLTQVAPILFVGFMLGTLIHES